MVYKARRVEKLLRVGVQIEKVRGRLSLKARARIFAAWSTVHRKSCLRRVKWLRGVSHRNARIQQCALINWQAWLSGKRRAQSLRLSALQHFAKRRLGAALAGWCRAKGAAIETRAKQSSAMHLWATDAVEGLQVVERVPQSEEGQKGGHGAGVEKPSQAAPKRGGRAVAPRRPLAT